MRIDIDVNTAKLLAAIAIFLCGLISTLFPLMIARKSEAYFSIGNMMASGVLLAAGLCHQLADSAESLNNNDFPWSFFICGLTFLMFMVFEETVHLIFASNNSHANSTIESEQIHEHNCQYQGIMPTSKKSCTAEIEINQHTYTHHHSDPNETASLITRRSLSASASQTHVIDDGSLATSLFIDVPRESVNQHHHDEDHIAKHLHGSFIGSVMLLMALSVHSLFEGFAIGIVSDPKLITSTAIAILLHKGFAGYSLGSAQVAAEFKLDQHIILGLIFSLSSPLGLFIGYLTASSTYENNFLLIGIVQAMVAGTFLYVAIIEVGMKELLICRHNTEDQWQLTLTEKQMEAIKLVAMLVGFVAMSLLAIYT